MVRAARYYQTAWQAVEMLRTEGNDPATLHRLRTHLRRLQSYLELAGQPDEARRISQSVSQLSRLRALDVFARYLVKIHAPKSDRRRVHRRRDKAIAKLVNGRVYDAIRTELGRLTIPTTSIPREWMHERLRLSRTTHANELRGLLHEAGPRPRRKYLHALRLRLKAVRYQEEWVSRTDRHLLQVLKRGQTVLGAYEDRADFRKLGCKLDLTVRSRINRDWRRARKRARAVPAELHDVAARLSKLADRQVKPTPKRSFPRSRPLAM